MVRYAKDLFDRRRNPCACPAIALKTECLRALLEQRTDLGELLVCQLRLLTGRRVTAQCFDTPANACLPQPLTDRALRYRQFRRNPALRPALLMQYPCPSSPVFTPV